MSAAFQCVLDSTTEEKILLSKRTCFRELRLLIYWSDAEPGGAAGGVVWKAAGKQAGRAMTTLTPWPQTHRRLAAHAIITAE